MPHYKNAKAKKVHKVNQQLHFNKRAEERLGVHVNRKALTTLLNYLLSSTQDGICANSYYANRYWFYIKLEGTWAWVLLDHCTQRLITIITEVPRGLTEEEIRKAIHFGTGNKRPWND
jgi:hypothetical protein